MRNIILGILLSIISTTAYSKDWHDTCSKLSGVAEKIMRNRQDGISMAKMINISNGSKIYEEMVIAAYDKPRFSTQKMKDRSIEDYGNDIYLSCAKAHKNKK